MAMRRKMRSSSARAMFSRTAGITQSLNLRSAPMRGGFRI